MTHTKLKVGELGFKNRVRAQSAPWDSKIECTGSLRSPVGRQVCTALHQCPFALCISYKALSPHQGSACILCMAIECSPSFLLRVFRMDLSPIDIHSSLLCPFSGFDDFTIISSKSLSWVFQFHLHSPWHFLKALSLKL